MRCRQLRCVTCAAESDGGWGRRMDVSNIRRILNRWIRQCRGGYVCHCWARVRQTGRQSICFQTHSRPFTPSYMQSYPLLLHARENTRSVSNLSTNSPVKPTSVATPRPQHNIVVGLFLTLFSFLCPPPSKVKQTCTSIFFVCFKKLHECRGMLSVCPLCCSCCMLCLCVSV